MMLLSIVIPCYNVEEYLNRCLSSLCDARLRGLVEALIINDGSTDATRDIALSYIEREPDIFTLIDKENGGHGSAVNAGIQAAHGKYLRIVDGDDWVETENMPILLEHLKSSEADLVIDQKYEVTKETGEKRFFPLPENTPFSHLLPFSDYCGDAMTEYYMLHTMNVRLELLHALGVKLLEHTFYVDFEYVLKVTSRAKTIEFVPTAIYDYLVGNAQQSVAPANYVKRQDQHRRVVDECLRFRHDATIPSSMTAYVTRRCQLLLHTHLNILLIYERNRHHGRETARLLMEHLKATEPDLYRLVKPRMRIALLLHYLGINDETLLRLKNVLKGQIS